MMHLPALCKTKRFQAFSALLLCYAIWGAAFPIAKPALEFLEPIQFLQLRYSLAGILMLPVAVYSFARKKIPLLLLPVITLNSLIGFTCLLLSYIALDMTSSIQASLIMNTSPVFVTIVGILFLHEIEEPREWVGLLLSLLGSVVLALGPVFFVGTSLGEFSLLATVLIIIGNTAGALTVIVVKRYYKDLPKYAVASTATVVGAVMFTVVTSVSTGFPTSYILTHPSVLPAVVYIAVFGTPVAMALQYIGYSKIEVSEATLMEYTKPLVYIPLSVLWLGETILPIHFFGLMCIILGVIIAESRTRPGSIFSHMHHHHHHRHH